MTGEKLKEFIRRLKAAGFQTELDVNGAGTVYRHGREVAVLKEDGEILYKPWSRQYAFYIRDMQNEVDEYMTQYLNAASVKTSRLRTAPRTLLEFNNAELAAKEGGNGFEFITWKKYGVSRDAGHYFSDYAAAKRDFAVRAGLIDRDRLFTETELTVIRSHLSDYLSIDAGDHITGENEKAIRKVIDKIDNSIVPEIREEAQEAEDMEREPVQEL